MEFFGRKAMRIREIVLAIFLLVATISPSLAVQEKTIRGTEIKVLVKDYVETNMPWQKDAIRLDFLGKIPDFHVQGGQIVCKVRSGRDESYIGDSIFTVGIYDDGTLLREEKVRVRMEVGMDVVISAKFLSRDTIIDVDDVKLVRKWFDQTPTNVLMQIEDVVGRQASGDIRQNMEIKRNMLKSVKTIKRGRMVKMIVENGPLTIVTVGLSEEDGSRGDFIRVKNISSNKIVYAKVIDGSSVRVDY